MGRHEGQVTHVSERPGQDLGDGVCPDGRALHGAHGDLKRGHRAFARGEHLGRHGALMHGGHQQGHRAVHVQRDDQGQGLHQGNLQGAEHRGRHRALVHGVQQGGHWAARDHSMSDVDHLLRQGHLRGGGRGDDSGWELTPEDMAWLQREGALHSARRGGGCIDVEEERELQRVLDGIPRKVWPSKYWSVPYVRGHGTGAS